jgi:hypothetical protein
MHTNPLRAMRLLPGAAFLLLCAAEWSAVLRSTSGAFSYSLDDPYIHLALAENIARGSYGVNLGEVAAPSSSVLWPFVLAPVALLSWAPYWPLIVNLISALLTLEVTRRLLALLFAARSPLADSLVSLGSLTFMLSTNAVGLAFAGMEHSLQVLCVTLALYGVWLERLDGRLRTFCLLALGLLPLIRYESAVLSGPLLAYLLWRGHARRALLTGALCSAVAGSFSLFLYGNGLGFLPTSVLAKAGLVTAPLAERLAATVQRSWSEPHIALFFALLFAFAVLAVVLRAQADRALALVFSVATLGHLFVGNFGWFDRYEVYLFGADILALAGLFARAARELDAQRGARVAVLAMLAVLMLSGTYLLTPLKTPGAARNIYEQQHQMHRFVAEYWQKPVAVNDLGLVSFRNDAYVLDLVGLAHKPALMASIHERGCDWKDRMAKKHGVSLAMIYDPMEGCVPSSWRLLGTLKLSGPVVSAGAAEVLFFALDQQAEDAARPMLARFERVLPVGVVYEAHDAAELELALP